MRAIAWKYLPCACVARVVIVDDVAESDAAPVSATTAKMADTSETQLLSGEKGAKIEPEKRQRRNWSYLQMSGKFGLTTKLPETLGVYDLSAVRERQKEYAAGNVKGPLNDINNVRANEYITSCSNNLFFLVMFGCGIILVTLREQA